MIDWYQHFPEHIDPIVFSVGFFSLYWYGVLYILALCAGGLVLRRVTSAWLSSDQFEDLILMLVFGILIGSRLGYVLLYNARFYMEHPLSIVWPFDTVTGAWIGIAGMSYYGGLVGAAFGVSYFSWKNKLAFWRVADALALVIPLGSFFGRVGNFLNGELYGRVTQKAWGMYFPQAPFGGIVLRHPSQLYEAFFEGVVLFIVLAVVSKKHTLPPGVLAAFYLIGYGFLRMVLEFFREPDPQIGFVSGWMSLGQILSAAIVVSGFGLFFWLRRRSVVQ